ncbi:MAG: LytR/AlgR family response regulator transcription factor [Thermoanaerobaculia bacterium]
MTLHSIIVDDEPLARTRLRKLLAEHPDVEVVDEAGSGGEAVDAIDEHRPELVFLDIEMPDFNGFEVLRRLRHRPSVIFTTGYDQYAMRAFEAAGIDYLLKPIEAEHLARALGRMPRARGVDDDFERRVEALLRSWHIQPASKAYIERIAVRLGERILLVDVKNITHFYAREKYVFARTTAGKEHIISQTIAELEEQLDPQFFARVHRATIVNVRYIKEIQVWFGGKFRILLDDPDATEVVVSKNMAKKLKTVIPF